MKRIITGFDHIFGPWFAEKTGGEWIPGRGSTIGLASEDGIAGVAYFTDCNGSSVILHCAGEGRKWLSREFLWFTFYYPFEQLNVRKIISPIEDCNTDSIKFIENIGFTLEATLKDASPKGNLLLYTLSKEDCKWLSLKDKYRGEAETTCRT